MRGLFYKLNVSDCSHYYKLIECIHCLPNGDVMFNMLYVCLYTKVCACHKVTVDSPLF